MKELWSQIQENLGFVLVCIVIIAALAGAARLAEHFLPEKRRVTAARRVSIVGICAAIATVLHMLDFPLLFLAPGFYKLDFSELPVLLAGFFLGPSATVACEGIKILLKLLLKGTSTAFVGDFANFAVKSSTFDEYIEEKTHRSILGESRLNSGKSSNPTETLGMYGRKQFELERDFQRRSEQRRLAVKQALLWQLNSLIDRLDEKEREIIVRRYVDGVRVEELYEILGISRATAFRRLEAGILRMADLYREMYEQAA